MIWNGCMMASIGEIHQIDKIFSRKRYRMQTATERILEACNESQTLRGLQGIVGKKSQRCFLPMVLSSIILNLLFWNCTKKVKLPMKFQRLQGLRTVRLRHTFRGLVLHTQRTGRKTHYAQRNAGSENFWRRTFMNKCDKTKYHPRCHLGKKTLLETVVCLLMLM